ncbi:hypothetical protein QL093DRAFT_2120293 [Fusarium oxysporum]|nr:hypothetical protein QL093DRAFT_2120293 [Fusarium oxysporum]
MSAHRSIRRRPHSYTLSNPSVSGHQLHNCHVLLAACSNIFHLLKSADDNLDSMVIQGRCHRAWASLDMRIDTNLELWILVEHGAVSALSCTFREAPDFWAPECDQRESPVLFADSCNLFSLYADFIVYVWPLYQKLPIPQPSNSAQEALRANTSRLDTKLSLPICVLGSVNSSNIHGAEDPTESALFGSSDDVFYTLRRSGCRCKSPNPA